MSYEKMKIGKFYGQKIYQILISQGYCMKEAQKLCDNGRIIDNFGSVLKKNSVANGDIFLIDYRCKPKGLRPIFECMEFGVFDKPRGGLNNQTCRDGNFSLME